MSCTGGASCSLAFLPEWLSDSETSRLETTLPEWVRQSGWKKAGLVWPLKSPSSETWIADTLNATLSNEVPSEIQTIADSFEDGSLTVEWQSNGNNRLYAPITPSGQPLGAVWIERDSTEPWTDHERDYLTLSARLIERSAHLTRWIGPVLDPVRLEHRLKDASVIAGRMAHDFDNILTGIMGFADLSLPLVPAGSQVARFISETNSVGARGIVFTQQLHQLSRSAQVKPQPSSVAAVLAKEEQRLKTQHTLPVQWESNVPQNLASVAIDAAPLATVLGHLIDNAIQATPPNGKVTVSARALDLTRADAQTYLGRLEPGPHVEITIKDTGTGIKPEIRAKLFAEPFFTTKVRHRGLGLAIVYRILFAHRGGIRIDAAVPLDPGTLVRVVLPLASVRPSVAPTASVTATTVGG